MSLHSFLGVRRVRNEAPEEIQGQPWLDIVRSLRTTFIKEGSHVYTRPAPRIDPQHWTDDGVELPADYPKFLCASTSFDQFSEERVSVVWEIELMTKTNALDLRPIAPYFLRALQESKLDTLPTSLMNGVDSGMVTESKTSADTEMNEQNFLSDFDKRTEEAFMTWLTQWVWPHWEDRHDMWQLTIGDRTLLGLNTQLLLQCCPLFLQAEYFLSGPIPNSDLLERSALKPATKNNMRVVDWAKQSGTYQQDIREMLRALQTLSVSEKGQNAWF